MSILNFKKIPITILITSFAITCGIIASLSFENSFAHNFSPDESAEFLTIVDKIKVESAIVANSSANNNQSSAISHAQYALNTYDSHTNHELSEKNERIATELNNTLHQLQDQVETSPSSITDKLQINQTLETINAILDEAVSVRIDDDQLNNSTIQALIFADIVNTALQSYGSAFDIGIDLTDISNLNTTSNENENNTVDNKHSNHGLQNITNQMNIVNFSSYESALSFADYALKKFNSEIKTSVPNNNKTQNYLEQLEKGLLEFNTAIKNKENPMKVMKIVHTKIHPNLQFVFNLKSE